MDYNMLDANSFKILITINYNMKNKMVIDQWYVSDSEPIPFLLG